MSSSTFAGNPDTAPIGFCPAPPPPPPPPPVPGQGSSLRITTAEAPVARRPRNSDNADPYEPPAAIQNAMMTKDKKPFTYTPGMGGKLDLSQIRSPRMARRVAKNANDEGIEGPPKSSLEPKPAASGPSLFVQPQVAVPVFPASMPAQPSVNRVPSSRMNRVIPSNVPDMQPEPARNLTKVTPLTITPNQPASPQSPGTPPQVALSKAPTPWLQNKKSQEDLPDWAKRTTAARPQDSSPESPISPQVYQQPQQYQTPQPQWQTPQQQQDRVIPIRIEDRPSVFSVKNEPGHHQLKQQPNHQQRWGQPQYQPQPQQSGGSRIVPIMVEDNRTPAASYSQPQVRSIPVDNQGPRVIVNRGPGAGQQQEPAPVQSRAFRVIQKITDTDSDNEMDASSEQVRKLQLTEDDKVLMNKFKEQVDGDTYLHQEEDPRYRGAAIPSRAFRLLQTMTDSGDVPTTANAQRNPSALNKKQNRNSKSFEEAQANLPASEQQVQEPKKYMGSAIPSRSFKLLQAMTAPENIATQENRQPDFISQTENNMPGNQQGVFFPNCPSPYWNPDGGWWGYYPMRYAPNTDPNNVAYDPYAYYSYGDGNAYAYYSMYDQNYARNDNNDRTEQSYPGGSDAVYGAVYPNCNGYEENYNQYYDGSVYPPSEEKATKENSKFLTVPKWSNPSNMSRSSSNSSRDSDDTTAMNITDEEESVPAKSDETITEEKLESSETTTVSIAEDTEGDSSESSEESSEDSGSSSTDSDSESEYVAYTTGPGHRETGKNEPKLDRSRSISEEAYEGTSDCESDTDDEYQVESLNVDCTLPHQLSVIYEEAENEERRRNNGREKSKELFEETDDPPDDGDSATVSVSLPLRFKFSVSENNEEVTTVTVGDSLVKSERKTASEEGISRSYSRNDGSNDVHVNLQIGKSTNTSVDFTLKKQKSEENFDTEFTLTTEETSVDLRESSVESVDAEVAADVEFTLKKDRSGAKKVDCNENVETEFVVRTKKTDVTKHVWKKDLDLDQETDTETRVSNDESNKSTKTECSVKNAVANGLKEDFDTEYTITNAKTEMGGEVCKEVVERKSLRIKEREETETEFSVKKFSKGEKSETVPEGRDAEVAFEFTVENEDNDNCPFNNKHLLSVQNSRDETDDEDSGVTSDMSRLISEVDTDSECTSSRKLSKYQRTQTHSRLFKLLNDDSILPEDSSEECDLPARREHLSLPLKPNVFNYDENYYSNYSSGITSPEYSPICEQSWRRIHEGRFGESENSSSVTTPNESVDYSESVPFGGLTTSSEKPNVEDPYFQTWKKARSPAEFDYDILPSIAFKKLENRMSHKGHKVNILCPRIKSTKNVPQVVQSAQKPANSSIPPSTPLSIAKNDHC